MKFLDQDHKAKQEEPKLNSNPGSSDANSYCNSRLVHTVSEFSGGMKGEGSRNPERRDL